MQIHLTPKSTNAKTGPIPVSTSTMASCPDSCSLRDNGCYASSGPLALHWRKVTNGERGTSWSEFCASVKAFPDSQLWRHNQAGDLPHIDGKIDATLMRQLIKANSGRRGFTYTHHNVNIPGNKRIILESNLKGFTINLSAESLHDADRLSDMDIGPVVTLLPINAPKITYTPKGRKVITCPATYREDTSCASCQLCQRQNRSIIGFPVHGTGKAKANKVFMLKSI